MTNISEAIKLGKHPDIINPEKRAKIEAGGLGYEPILPKNQMSHEVASASYKRAMDYLKRYIPPEKIPQSNEQFIPLLMGMMQTLPEIKEIENPHSEYLEMLAIDTVLGLPEFDVAKKAYDSGQLKIEATLIQAIMPPAPPEEMEAEIEQIETEHPDVSMDVLMADMDQERMKRRFANVMAQGAAASYMYLFEFVRNELESLNPQLPDMYGFMNSIGDMAYWAMPEMSMGEAGEAGEESIEQEEDGAGVIKVKGIIFPILVHELVKGLIEYVNSHGLHSSPDVAQGAMQDVDTPENEVYDLMLGPVFWKKLTDAMGSHDSKLLLHVWSKIISLPAFDPEVKGGFANFLKEFLSDPVAAKRIVGSFINDIQNAIEDYEKTEGGEEYPPVSFESYAMRLDEALTNAMKSLLLKYPDMTEEQLEKWAAVDPTGQKGINLPQMLKLFHNKKLKSPKEVKTLVDGIPEPNATLPWVLRQIGQDQIRIPEDTASVADVLKTYYKFRKTRHWPEGKQDLHKFAGFADLSKIVADITMSSLGSAMKKRMSILPGTELLGVEPPYEVIRIYPTLEAQKSLSQYREVNGKEYARWCTGRPDSSGVSHFWHYLNLDAKTAEEKAAVHDDPLFSYYLIAKDGLPYALFDFQSNNYMNIHDQEFRNNDPEYIKQIKNIIMKFVPGAEDIISPKSIPQQPSVVLASVLQKQPQVVANIVMCKVRSRMGDENWAKIRASLTTDARINNLAAEAIQSLMQRLPGDVQQKDNEWNNRYNSRWLVSTNARTNLQQNKIEIGGAIKKAFFDIIKNDSFSCETIDVKKPLIDCLIEAGTKKPMTESRLSKILGTAALAGTMGISSLNPNNRVPEIQRQPPIVQNAAKPQQPPPASIVDHGPKHLPEHNWKSRGLKNNNPGNIKKGEHWDGAVGHDGQFLRFKSMEHGIRALAKILRTYQMKYNLNTVEQIITKFAPRKDHNPTQTYINDVCEYMGVKRDQKIDLNNKIVLLDLVNAMIRMETGRDLSDNVVKKGIQMAGV